MNCRQLLIVIFSFLTFWLMADSPKSPHGPDFKIDCTTCHQTDGWKKIKENGFNHNKTKFPLTGQHKSVSCLSCHPTKNFSDAKTACSSCHTDMHEGTVGIDCEQCHNTNSWIVNNVRQIHQREGFVLLGQHATADCKRCHTSASKLRFENIRSDCYSCHQTNYENTTSPNHKTANFGTNCESCHSMIGQNWTASGRGFDHGFFPLTGGHNIECTTCHYDNFQENLSPQCRSCHGVKNSNPILAHKTKFAGYECNSCHNINSWNTVSFKQHDSWGKIYSGEHKGKWTSCIDCHNNDAAYVANCSKCHSFSTGTLP